MIFIYPTDTAYAIGCDARDEEAIKKIFKIKGREKHKTLPLIASDIDMVKQWCNLSGKAEQLAEQYWRQLHPAHHQAFSKQELKLN